MSDGKCDVPEPCVYKDGLLNRCTYDFGHQGDHSWQKLPYQGPFMARRLGWGSHDRDNGKLSPEEAPELQEHEDDPLPKRTED